MARASASGHLLRVVACWTLGITAAACSQDERPFVFRYANEQPEAAIRSQSMLFFEKEREKRSGGHIEVEV